MKLSPPKSVEMFITKLPNTELPGHRRVFDKGESSWISDEH